MSPLAKKLNDNIEAANPAVLEMLSDYGKRIFFPSAGILAQSADAKKNAYLYNATIGIATENKTAMGLKTVTDQVNLPQGDYLPYAPSFGNPALRKKWQELQLEKNPSLKGKACSLPIVTNALTHGISLASSLFVNSGEKVILSDHFWGNYNLYFNVTLGAKLCPFELFEENSSFNQQSFEDTLMKEAKGENKITVILNFPNNPTGYTIHNDEVDGIVNSIKKVATTGTKVVVMCDDAYFGLFFEDDVLKESIFAYLADCHKNVLAIKIDGATKEDYVWGLRCGFLTFACKGSTPELYTSLEEKAAGAIRATISNVSNLGQKIVLESLNSPEYASEKAKKFKIMQDRYEAVKAVLMNEKFSKYFTPYPYNSGYFMTMKINNDTIIAEEFRQYLIKNKGIGVIAIGTRNIRIAFSCTELENIADLFNKVYEAAEEFIK